MVTMTSERVGNPVFSIKTSNDLTGTGPIPRTRIHNGIHLEEWSSVPLEWENGGYFKLKIA